MDWRGLMKKAVEFVKNGKNRRRWKNIVRTLVFAAVFCTTYALILPALTLEGDPVCGFEENEIILHSHDENCYDSEGTLLCSEPESKTHLHAEECFAESSKTVLICEAEEHIHDEKCYGSEETETEYICGMGVHAHIESCYDETGALICTIPEHAHGAECVSDEVDLSADTETSAEWEADLSGISFSGNWAKDILAVAESQLGYSESTENVVLVNDELKGYTRYGEKYGDPYGDWSAMFVSFCIEYAGIKDFETETESERWLLNLEAEQKLLSGEFVPENGDIVFVDTDDDGEAEMVGIVSGKVSGTSKIEFIAGDTENGCVEYLIYEMSDSAILGYCELPENPMAEEEIHSAVM